MKNKIYYCDKCGRTIGDHNQFLHNGMCDDCFFETYFPEEIEIFEKDADNLVKRCEQKERENTME